MFGSAAGHLATVLMEQGEFPEAGRLHRETLEARRRALGREHPYTLESACNVALVLLQQGEFSESALALRETLEAPRRALGAEHPDALESAGYLATALENLAIPGGRPPPPGDPGGAVVRAGGGAPRHAGVGQQPCSRAPEAGRVLRVRAGAPGDARG